MRRPPALPTWLLDHLVAKETLAGDLVEEYESGQSDLWYTMQVLVAITHDAVLDIRRHKLQLLLATLIGGASLMWWAGLLSLIAWTHRSDL